MQLNTLTDSIMGVMMKIFSSCGHIFTVGNNRTKLIQWIVVMMVVFSIYVLLYAGTSFKTLFSKIELFKSSPHLSIREFQLVLFEQQKQRNNSGLFVQSNGSLCPVIPPKLVGSIKVNTDILSYAAIENKNKELQAGGRYSPSTCLSRHHVAILIPYRDRQSHLKVFLQNIHPFLQKQQLDYGIFVIEMVSGVKFNRALLFNIGFTEALKANNYDCFIFHDVDLLPENDLNLYTCSEKPRHMSVAIDKYKYRLPYSQIFGGASAMTKEQFEKVNGFSNLYFGWGGEDDDMYNRIVNNKMNIIRYSADVARYKMLSHGKDTPNPVRFKLLNHGKKRFESDGLNSLKYDVLKTSKKKLYTWVLVSVNDSVTVSTAAKKS